MPPDRDELKVAALPVRILQPHATEIDRRRAVAIPILRAGKFCRRGPNRRHAKRNGKPIPGGLLALPPC